jgi:hypothetical protein
MVIVIPVSFWYYFFKWIRLLHNLKVGRSAN